MRSVEKGADCSNPRFNRDFAPRWSKSNVWKSTITGFALVVCCWVCVAAEAQSPPGQSSNTDCVLMSEAPLAPWGLGLGLMDEASPDEPFWEGNRTVIDVMVLYTGLAKEACGGEASVRAKIALAIAFMNEACNRSGVHAKLRLIHHEETTWHSEGERGADELYWLANDRKVAELRNQVGADLVSLMVRDGRPTGGIAQLPGSFSVFNGSPFVFAHEIGHNLGCAHDRANAGYAYGDEGCNYGYSFTPPGTSVCYGAIMSYAGSQIQQFSNPNNFFLGIATGIPEGHRDEAGMPDSADNALTLNRAIPYAATVRSPQVTLLDNPLLSQDGAQFSFRIAGFDSGSCTIEHTADHEAWTVLTKFWLTGDGAEVADAAGGRDHRFYRARVAGRQIATQIGFIKKDVPVGFSMIANPLDALDNTVESLFPTAPEGTQIYKWIDGLQSWTCNTFSFDEWDIPQMALHPGEGIVINNRSGAPFRVSFAGEVIQACHNRIPIQLSVRSSAIPQAGLLSSVLRYIPFGAGGQVFRMAGGRYTGYTWDGRAWSPEEPVIEMGEAFWCRNPVNPLTWQRARLGVE